MYVNIEPFGILVYGEMIGSAWLSLVESILKNGDTTEDEGRKRLSLQNVRMRAVTQSYLDPLIKRYAVKKNIDQVVRLTFEEKVMYDFDVISSFSKGSKSYWARIKEGKMFEYVIQRLTEIPESKKAVISFIHWDDYEAVLKNPKDDYLPCVTTIQFRLLGMEKMKGYYMNTLFSARSIDAFQKAPGNFTAMMLLSQKVTKELEKNLKVPVVIGSLDGMIADAHIYKETVGSAEQVIEEYKKYEHNNSDKITS